jgi:hypothetical protein
MKRLMWLVMAIALAMGSVASSARAQSIPELPIPELPAPPAQLKPVLGAPSPTVFQACQAETTLLSLAQAAYTIGGLPVNPGLALSEIRRVSPLGQLCGYFRISVIPPRCSIDDQIPPLPVTIPRPASLLASQIKAIEKSTNQLGAPMGYPVSSEAYSQLGCR